MYMKKKNDHRNYQHGPHWYADTHT